MEIDNPLRFQGQYHDAETGLHYNFQRYYDPRDGRFVTPGPGGLLAGANLYGHVSDPLLWIDQFGARRLVLDRQNQSAYYSDDHYDSFIDVSQWVFP